MFNIGDNVIYLTWDDNTGEDLQIPAKVMFTFYEPGDYIQGVNILTETGERYSVCSSNCIKQPKIIFGPVTGIGYQS